MRRRWMIAAALAASVAALPAQSQDNAACNAMVGTWLTTIENGAGAFASRSLITVHAEGTLSMVDSAQDRGVQGSAFSGQQGAWRCDRTGSATARSLNFGFPDRPSIARSDWTFRDDGGALSGTVALHIFAGVKDVDPFRDSPPVGTFKFTAQRVTAR